MSRKNDWIKRCFYDGNLGRSSRLIGERRASTVLGACLAVLVAMFLLACPSPGEEEAKVTGITLSVKDANFIKLNKTITLSVEVTGSGDYDKSVTWSSSRDTVAVVDGGVVTGKSVGTVTITAKSVADTSVSGSIELEVKADYIDTVTINGGNLELGVGIKRILTATVTVEGTLSDAEKTITWSSDQPNIVSIDASSGELETKAEGTARISAKAGGMSSVPITITVIDTTRTIVLPIDFTKFDTDGDENKNIYKHFINEDYDPDSPLNLALNVELPDGLRVTPPLSDARNYSDQAADIFTVTKGSSTYKFRLNIFRKPIIVTARPAANTDSDYDSSGAAAISMRRFVQTDYYYVPTAVDGEVITIVEDEEKIEIQKVPTDHPAPTFALFPETAKPTADNILISPVRVLRNFVTKDGNTIFFTGADDGVADDEWSETGLNTNADVLAALTPNTKYSLHWAVDANNGKFSGSLGDVSTTALPSSEPTTGSSMVKYHGVGGMEVHPVMNNPTLTVPIIYSWEKVIPNLVFYNVSGIGIIGNANPADPSSYVLKLHNIASDTNSVGILAFNQSYLKELSDAVCQITHKTARLEYTNTYEGVEE